MPWRCKGYCLNLSPRCTSIIFVIQQFNNLEWFTSVKIGQATCMASLSSSTSCHTAHRNSSQLPGQFIRPYAANVQRMEIILTIGNVCIYEYSSRFHVALLQNYTVD